MKVKMLVKTALGGKRLAVDDITTVDKEVAERWIGNGLAVLFDASDEVEDESDGFPPMLLSKEELEKLPPEQLKDYANAHKVDIGRATTYAGILEKILEAGKIFTESVEV